MRCCQQFKRNIISLRARLVGGNCVSLYASLKVTKHIRQPPLYNTAKTSSRRARVLAERNSRESSSPFQTNLVL